MRARSFGSERSALKLFLLRLNSGKKPAPDPINVRVLSPPGGSTLTTSAPRSPRIMPQVGPITMCVNSTTRTPLSGRLRTCAAVLRTLDLRAGRGLVFRAIVALACGRYLFFDLVLRSGLVLRLAGSKPIYTTYESRTAPRGIGKLRSCATCTNGTPVWPGGIETASL